MTTGTVLEKKGMDPRQRKKIIILGALGAWLVLAGVLAGKFWMIPDEKAAAFPIDLTVDFGPAGKDGHAGTLFVERNTTPTEAVAQVYPVLFGKTCCSLKDVMEIGGVRVDPVRNMWWTVWLNGSKKFSPRKKKLRKGDKLEWRYVEESQ